MAAPAVDPMLELRCYTVTEVAELTGVSRGLIYKEIHAGRLPYVNLGSGHKYRVRHADLERFLDENTGVVG